MLIPFLNLTLWRNYYVTSTVTNKRWMWHGAELWVAHSLEGSNFIPQIHSNSERSIFSFNFYKNPFLYTNSLTLIKLILILTLALRKWKRKICKINALRKNSITVQLTALQKSNPRSSDSKWHAFLSFIHSLIQQIFTKQSLCSRRWKRDSNRGSDQTLSSPNMIPSCYLL